MRLKRAHIKNFKLLEDVELRFSLERDRPLTMIRAENGSGKTSVLYALLWAFFGERGLPLSGEALRLTSTACQAGVPVEVSVQVDFQLMSESGSPAEFQLLRVCQETPGEGDSVNRSDDVMRLFRVEPGEIRAIADRQRVLRYTDDTHMMIGVAESLVANRGFDGEHMAQTFLQNFEREPWRGYGPGPPRIFRMIRGGEAWDKAAERIYPGGSYGNGSAMRIAPVGVFFRDEPSRLREVAHASSRITHAHELGMEGAALQAYAVALAASLDPTASLDRHDFLREMGEFVSHPVYRQKLAKMAGLWGEPDRSRIVVELGNGIEAFNSVPTAVFSFLYGAGSFEDSVLYAISLGGDTDTIGAMTGAICGAYLGVQAIPQEWREKLENREHIQALAEELWRIKMRVQR